MEITSKDKSSFQIKGKNVSLLINPTDLNVACDAAIITDQSFEQNVNKELVRLVVKGPGEYELRGVGIVGRKVNGEICFKIAMDGVSVLYLPKVPQDKTALEEFSPIDILILGEYADSIYELDPKIIVPVSEEIAEKLGKDKTSEKKLVMTKEKLPQDLKVVVLHD